MAWNEPGKDKKREPWQDGEPPDFDAALKQIKDRLAQFFGGGGGSGLTIAIAVIVALLLVVALADSFKQINESTRGVVLRFGKVNRIMTAGLNLKWPRPIEEVLVVDTARVQSYSAQRVRILTSDENLLDIDFNVQFRAENPQQWLFGARGPETNLEQASESAVRQVVGSNTMDKILSEERTAMASAAKEELQRLLERYHTGIVVTGLNFQNLRPPEKVQAAFDDAIAAREDNQRFKNQADAYA
ncbi:MAG: FtsH protease activity modulator HflK, partial [Lysobacterales bacterium CG_4_9_14_3_um_filter_62_6]